MGLLEIIVIVLAVAAIYFVYLCYQTFFQMGKDIRQMADDIRAIRQLMPDKKSQD